MYILVTMLKNNINKSANMQKVLLTGGNGFIGQHLVRELRSKNYDLHLINGPGSETEKNLKNDNVYFIDILDYKNINKVIQEISPEYVIHLAGLTSIARSYDDFNNTMNINYSATVNLAESCRKQGTVKQFIFVGSSDEYGPIQKNKIQKINEDMLLNPASPYAVSKANAELYLQYMGNVYDFPYTIIRPFNTYGRKDNNSFFIEKTISKMLLKEQSISLGNPSLVRDWLYVDDHVSGYMKVIGNKRAIGQAIQLCTGQGHSIRETAELISKMTGYSGQILWNTMPKRPFEAKIMIGDNTKAKELLGWEPKHTLEQGLGKTIAFWKEKLKA